MQARELCLFCNCIELQMIFVLSRICLSWSYLWEAYALITVMLINTHEYESNSSKENNLPHEGQWFRN